MSAFLQKPNQSNQIYLHAIKSSKVPVDKLS